MPIVNIHTCGFPANAIYIGRSSKWGNPFRIGVHGTRRGVLARYEKWLLDQDQLLRDLDELRGKTLVCYCAPKKCHGDLLHYLANSNETDRILWWCDVKKRLFGIKGLMAATTPG